jgi:hypothetical protein
MADLATINERKAKTKQKSYYDKKSRSRKLEVDQKVLVLLPTHTSKLLASWHACRIAIQTEKNLLSRLELLCKRIRCTE